MQEIEIINMKLKFLQVSMNEKEIQFEPDNVQAMLQIKHNFDNETKEIQYHIVVGENTDAYLFIIDCTYQFNISNTTILEEEIVKEAMRLLESHVEEILAFTSMEGGYITESHN
ncbi:MAG: hypothetical protein ACK5LC_13870 [Coprobacillaceae bacterium]